MSKIANDDAQESVLRPAEWVLPGHPDRLADAVAERLVEAAERLDPMALCAVEVAVHRDRVYLTGRLACAGSLDIDIAALVRAVYAEAGYGDQWRPAPEELVIDGNLCLDDLAEGEAEVRHLSDDQCIATGYAIDLPGMDWLPPEHWIARELAGELTALVHGPLQLCPDGKLLVVLQEWPRSGTPALRRWAWRTVSASLLAPDTVDAVELHRAVRRCVLAVLARARRLLPGLADSVPEILVNPGGGFHIGGPEGDNGLSGKKLLLDYHGPRVPIGGGALKGKDGHKPDRVAAEHARSMALEIIRSGEAHEATVTVIMLPGDEEPRVMGIERRFGTDDPRLSMGHWLVQALGGRAAAGARRSLMDTIRKPLWITRIGRDHVWIDATRPSCACSDASTCWPPNGDRPRSIAGSSARSVPSSR